MPAHLVWLMSNGRLVPQIWPEFLVGEPINAKTNKPVREPVARHALSVDEVRSPIDQLAKKYPPPAIADQGERYVVAQRVAE